VLFYLAAADASIACWDAKYTYNFWRPLSAIRGGAVEGNDFTQADPLWQPYIATPPHPDYPSGHSTNSSAMATTLQRLFGEPYVPLSIVIFDSLSNTNITRRWETFGEAVNEVIEARIYSGIHFRTADEVGARFGRQTAQFVLTHALRPCRCRGTRSCGEDTK
jgi:PAP2 superfamily